MFCDESGIFWVSFLDGIFRQTCVPIHLFIFGTFCSYPNFTIFQNIFLRYFMELIDPGARKTTVQLDINFSYSRSLARIQNHHDDIFQANCFSIKTRDVTRFCTVSTIIYVKVGSSLTLKSIFDMLEHLVPSKLSNVTMYFDISVTLFFVFLNDVKILINMIRFRTFIYLNLRKTILLLSIEIFGVEFF